MAFRYSLENHEVANIIEESVKEFISRGFRTQDLTEDTSFLKTGEVASELIPIIKEKSDV
jgi:isocitrate/isopropylmalate dehydrogenase